ncbi:MAG: hypothetical protein P4L57_01655 [Rhizomicrobium sp.]|nr:hypothetical protein [Rhizomicrobium sp.]
MPDLSQFLTAQTLAVVATLGALLTALVNYHQGRIAARAHKAQIYLEFSARYNAPEIAVALQALVDWRRQHGDAFAEIFRVQFQAQDPAAVQINFHRRTVNAYFIDVATAYRAGVVSRAFAKLAIDHPGASVWRYIADPMSIALYENSESDWLPLLLKIDRHFGARGLF